MSISTPYSDFIASNNNVLASDGGPWRTPASTSDVLCWSGTTTRGFCGNYGCIHCSLLKASVILSFNLKYIANISISTSQFGNPDYVDYTFDYNLNWASDKTAAGAPLLTRVTVGDSSYIDNFGASDHAWLWYSEPASLGDPFTHSGTTSLVKSADGQTAYIPITLDFSFTRQQGGDCTWYFTSRSFRITPKSTSSSPSSRPGTIPAGSLSSTSPSSTTGPVTQSTQGLSYSLSNVILPEFSTLSISSSLSGDGSVVAGSDSSSSSPNVSSVSAQSVPTAAIIGGVLGGLSLLGFLALFLLSLYRRRKKQLMERDKNDLVNTQEADGEGGDDDSRRLGTTTVHSGSFIGFGATLGEPKYSHQHDGFVDVATTPSTIPSPSNQSSHPHVNLQPIPQQRESRRRRATRVDHRPQPSLSNYGTAFNMDVPPPAYSDVGTSETMSGRHYQVGESEDEDEDEDEENLGSEDDVAEAQERTRR
ncbi:hypothetical protein FRC18_005243 [Serendipita sp. 400]|nr:hypothetical protein FRC18_005243 [Serendipita sp. 400]